MRQRAANSNVVPFPMSRLASRFVETEDTAPQSDRRIPFGLCLLIWAALAAIGWSALDVVARLV